ncbi:MAG: PDZ domain-containing protein [Lachnospiraceae bacterium]|nr:PDZ domain-containing protein [Lachnospiraceae bacterium]
MYENDSNQYPNYYSPYSEDGNTSHTDAPVDPGNPIPPEPKKHKKKGGFFGKFVKMALSGVVFGLCAGSIMVIMLHLAPSESKEEKSEAISVTENANHVIANQDIVEDAESVGTANISGNTVVSDVSKVVENTMPSVVSITGMYKVEENNYFGFRNFITESESPGSGSGIIVGQNDTELLIATNNHVVEDATSLSVQFIDDTTADAVVKGTNADVDLAVIAISLENIPEETKSVIRVASLGDSDQLKVGEPAIAIGNALGYGQSVTTGVISAANREYTIEENTACLIQTDAAINPGNSGGALLNARGEVIGINSSKIGGSLIEGMGYAIPISTAKPIIAELMTKTTRIKVDEAQKAYLGIVGLSVTNEVQEAYGLPEGVYVTQVFAGTGAANAGLVKGDIIVEFDGEKVRTMEELTFLLECYEKGSTVEIKIMQGSPSGYQEKFITVTLGGRVDS